MAYKYNQTRKDKMDESRGMKKYYKGEGKMGEMSKDFVTGHYPGIGRNDFAGMPRETVMDSYPPTRMRRGAYLDDSMAEIDAIQVDSEHQVESNLSHQK